MSSRHNVHVISRNAKSHNLSDTLFANYSLRDFIQAAAKSRGSLRLRDAPIFYCSHIFALCPYTQRGQRVELSYVSFVYSLALLIVFAVHTFLHVQHVLESEQSNYNILLYSSYAMVNIVFATACIVAPILSRKSINSILASLSKVDAIISSLRPEFQFRENCRRQRLQVCFTLGITLLLILSYEAALRENIFPSFTYIEFYILPVTWLVIFQLDYLLLNLHKRFVFINSQLEHLVRESEIAAENGATNGTLDFLRLNKLNFVHFTLYGISSEVNDTFSIQLLVMIPRLIFFSVLPLHYNIVSALVNDPKSKSGLNPWSHIFTLSYIVLLTTPIIYVVNKASGTASQAKRVNTLIHDLIDEDQQERVEYELHVLSVQLLHRKIEFSVKHFFSLKPSLTTTMLELIITYVIIILQFQDTLSSVSPIRLLLRPLHQFNQTNNFSTVAPFLTTNNE